MSYDLNVENIKIAMSGAANREILAPEEYMVATKVPKKQTAIDLGSQAMQEGR
jgi:hypothetical protein